MFWKEEEIVEEQNYQHNKHFSYIYKKGKRISTKNLTLFVLQSKYNNYKIGFSVSKKLGKANERNKLKRRLREIVRVENLPKNFNNYVLLAREGSQNLEFDKLKAQVVELFKKWIILSFLFVL